ncbi:MAG: CHRD domain-containing protein [Deltaproteobacteria bacterium]|nr:CHRD domain-containing protein [Deltaproteobacteria bacterium]
MTPRTLCWILTFSLLTAATPTHAGSVIPFLFPADGGQEAPPIVTTATGGCFAVLDGLIPPAAQLNIGCAHNIPDATAAHIHIGAPGVSGPIVFDLGDPSTSPFFTSWPDLTTDNVADILAGNLYVNIHSTTHPSGEVRGQIVEPASLRFVAKPNQGESVPPTGSAAVGDCSATLSNPPADLTVACTHDVFMPTVAHIHRGAAGTTGPVVFDLGDPTSPINIIVSPGPEGFAELAAGLFYVNIHSDAFPAGEIRGQLVSDRFFADGFESGDTTGWSLAVP